MNLGQRLRELRTERHLRLRDVADRAGLSTPYISDLERSRMRPTLDTLGKVAAALNVTMRDVLTGVDLTPPAPRPLPPGLAALAADRALAVPRPWIECLARIEHQGRRPRTKEDYLELYLHLRRVLR